MHDNLLDDYFSLQNHYVHPTDYKNVSVFFQIHRYHQSHLEGGMEALGFLLHL